MIELIGFILEYWWAIIWAVAVLIAYRFGGWRLALAALLPGIGYAFYRRGRKDADQWRRERDAKMERRLEDEYRSIEDRGIDRDSLTERLRDGKF